MVLDQGFAWNGRSYPSLSAVAFAITGTKWNGRRFFGLDRQDSGRQQRKGGEKPRRVERDRTLPIARSSLADLQPIMMRASARPDRLPCRRSAAVKPVAAKQLRCAIYTRVSTEHGLEQEFNSLDNQREAAQAYIKSQAHEGWRPLPRPLRRWRLLGRIAGAPCPAKAPGRHPRPPHRCGGGLQGRPPHPLAGRLRQAGRAVRPARRVLRVRHPDLQHHHQHGAADPQRAAVLRPVRAGGHGRAHPRQDRGLQAQGHLGRRHRAARLCAQGSQAHGRRDRGGDRPADLRALPGARLAARRCSRSCGRVGS